MMRKKEDAHAAMGKEVWWGGEGRGYLDVGEEGEDEGERVVRWGQRSSCVREKVRRGVVGEGRQGMGR